MIAFAALDASSMLEIIYIVKYECLFVHITLIRTRDFTAAMPLQINGRQLKKFKCHRIYLLTSQRQTRDKIFHL